MFMRMFNDIEWWTNQNEPKCLQAAVEVASYPREFEQGRWSFLGPGSEESGAKPTTTSQRGNGDVIAQFFFG